MLKHLLIKNYALIKHLEIDPAEGMNIITGETGAGKSIMLGALGMLMGDRADTKVLLNEADKCVIEGVFSVEAYHLEALFEESGLDFEAQCTIRREISPAGKSRAFINDTPVNLETLRLVARRLMDIHSQHDTLQLGADTFQLQLLDAYAQNSSILENYRKAYHTYKKAEQTHKKLIADAAAIRKEYDYNKFLLEELTKANLDMLNQADMEQELEVLDNVESIKLALSAVLQQLGQSEHSAESNLRIATTELRKIAGMSSRYAGFQDRLSSVFIEIRDLVSELEDEEGRLFYDEEKAFELRTQLDQLYALQKKHSTNEVAQLIALRKNLEEKVNRVQNLDEEIEIAAQNKQKAFEVLMNAGEKLTLSRSKAAPKIQHEADQLLKEVGIPNARLIVQVNAVAPNANGCDLVDFLFSANKGINPEPLKNVASGGEFSRLMLCIKYVLAGKTALPTIIFDEIDTGISGEIAIKVSNMLRDMSERHQVFVISHLPQTAANGSRHYYVYKDDSSERSVSRIRLLDEKDREMEIAQMIGGASPSATALESARELLARYR